MAVFSSLFGEKQLTPPVPAQAINVTEIPKELAPYYKDILSKAQALYNQRMDEGYQPYTGATLAEFTPEQEQAFTGIAGLVGSTAPVFDEAQTMTRTGAAPITAEQIESYMSPYQQAVTDIEKREATKQFESEVIPKLAEQAVQAQAFGGSRQAILEGMAADTQQRLLADIQAKGSAQAYQDAVNRLTEERTRTGQAATQLANIGTQGYKQAAAELSGLGLVGEARQQQAQTAIDNLFQQYLTEREYPYQQIGKYQSLVTGAPLGQTVFEPSKPATFGPSVGQQLITGLGGLGQLYGQFTGKTIGGQQYPMYPGAPAKTGGGISSLVKRANNGIIGDPLTTEAGKYLEEYEKNKPQPYFNINTALPWQDQMAAGSRLLSTELDQMRTGRKNVLDTIANQVSAAEEWRKTAAIRDQFDREQALFKAMSDYGMSPEVTGPEGTTAGMKIANLLGKIGTDVGKKGTEIKARNITEQKELDNLRVQLKQAEAAGNLDLVQALTAQIGAIASLNIQDISAQAALKTAENKINKFGSAWSQGDILSQAAQIVGDEMELDKNTGAYKPKGKLTGEANTLSTLYTAAFAQLIDNNTATISYQDKNGNAKSLTVTMADLGLSGPNMDAYKTNTANLESNQLLLMQYIARETGLQAINAKKHGGIIDPILNNDDFKELLTPTKV